MFWRGVGGTKLALGAGGSGIAAIAIVALLLLAFGKCSIPFLGNMASLRTNSTPSPSIAGIVANSPSQSPSATAVTSGTPTPITAPTATPSTASTATPTPLAAALFIKSLPWHAGEVSVPYAPVALVATGGTPPYTWSISSSALPTGLTLSSDGVVSGNPSISGGPFTVRVDDSAGQAAGAKTTIPIAARFSPGSPCAGNGCSVEQGCVNVCGTYASINGGVGPYQYTIQPGAKLPNGSTFVNGPALAGTINSTGQFSVDIVDSFGVVGTVSALINVFTHLAVFAQANPGSGPTNAPVTIVMPYRGGDGKITSVTVTAPPGYAPKAAGATFTYTNSTITLTIPPPFQPNSWTLTVNISDGSPCGPTTGPRCAAPPVSQPMTMG